MYRYLVFGGESYYASGGCYDLLGKFKEEELSQAMEFAKYVEDKYLVTINSEDSDWKHKHSCDWVRLFDLYENTIIYTNGCGICSPERMVVEICETDED